MKIYAIYDDKHKKIPLGYLFYYEYLKEYIIELIDGIDEWDAPLLFQRLVREKKYTVPKQYAALWVKERVIPSGRQNIGQILKNAKLSEYDEMKLLALSKGRCSQDSCYIKETTKELLPEEIKRRRLNNITACFVSGENKVICLHNDNRVRKIDLNEIKSDNREIECVTKNINLFHSVKVGTGGYSISFNDSIDIPVDIIINKGTLLSVEASDFINFVKSNIIETSNVCEMLDCSKQTVAYYNKINKLNPVIHGAKINLYYKGDVERFMSE